MIFVVLCSIITYIYFKNIRNDKKYINRIVGNMVLNRILDRYHSQLFNFTFPPRATPPTGKIFTLKNNSP